MAPPQTQTKASKKRTRKRKRRAADISSSSSSSQSSSDDERTNVVAFPTKKQTIAPVQLSSASSASSSDSEQLDGPKSRREPDGTITDMLSNTQTEQERPNPRRSPSPPRVTPFSFLPPGEQPKVSEVTEKEKMLKEKFRKYWMSTIADEFKNDLDEIRKEPNLTTSRLSMLINSLASGAEVFSSGSKEGIGGSTNEMELVLNSE